MWVFNREAITETLTSKILTISNKNYFLRNYNIILLENEFNLYTVILHTFYNTVFHNTEYYWNVCFNIVLLKKRTSSIEWM